MARLNILTLLLFTLLMASCQIPNAKKPDKKKVFIVSDFLEVSDTLLFADFAKASNTRVVIVPRTINELMEELKNKNYSSGYDVVIAQSLYGINLLYRNQMIHKLSGNTIKGDTNNFSLKHGFLGIGIDPYIILKLHDSIPDVLTYNDLTLRKFNSNLSPEEEVPLLSNLFTTMDRTKVYSWAKTYRENANSDSLSGILLCKMHHRGTLKKGSPYFRSTAVNYPRAGRHGTLYDMYTGAIIRQAENYTEGLDLINWLNKPANNKAFCRHFKIHSDYFSTDDFVKTGVPVSQLLQYYTMTDRVLRKVQ